MPSKPKINIFDWSVVRAFVKKRKPVEVSAGLLSDWFWTAATIYKKGKFIRNHRAFLHSKWAIAGFKAEMKSGDVIEVVANKAATAAEIRQIARKHAAHKKKMASVLENLRARKSQ